MITTDPFIAVKEIHPAIRIALLEVEHNHDNIGVFKVAGHYVAIVWRDGRKTVIAKPVYFKGKKVDPEGFLTPELEADVAQAIEELNIQKPVRAVRVVGDRIELYLLGGGTAIYEPDAGEDPGVLPDLETLSLKELRKQAKAQGIKRYSRMNKARLLDLLAQRSPPE